jgi:hypothetical protein
VDSSGLLSEPKYVTGESRMSLGPREITEEDYKNSDEEDFRVTKMGEKFSPYQHKKKAVSASQRHKMPPSLANASMRKDLRNNNTFLTEMDQTLSSLQSDTKLRSRLIESLQNMDSLFTSQRLHEENNYNETVKNRIETRRKEKEIADEIELDYIIDMTAKRSAMQAINLTNLLKQKWTEDKQAYKIESQITTWKQKKRLNDMTSNRYKV